MGKELTMFHSINEVTIINDLRNRRWLYKTALEEQKSRLKIPHKEQEWMIDHEADRSRYFPQRICFAFLTQRSS